MGTDVFQDTQGSQPSQDFKESNIVILMVRNVGGWSFTYVERFNKNNAFKRPPTHDVIKRKELYLCHYPQL